MLSIPEITRDAASELALFGARGDAGNGVCKVLLPTGRLAACIVSNGMGWEHVSVSFADQTSCATWEEMCYIKELFWEEDDCAVQYHPRKSEYRNHHKGCLHLWRPTKAQLPEPPPEMVAPSPTEQGDNNASM